ncbi:hypothetical protein F0562_028104 [Nyssa sinensis]|uniref:C2 domain-containing protein n=1 Tax=Nyssa sinensis TaxID=561372 RepID=A0A5J5B5K1_9ASTE|nr:hypothetical protein F0562_028104 [Nyssa sinensis]
MHLESSDNNLECVHLREDVVQYTLDNFSQEGCVSEESGRFSLKHPLPGHSMEYMKFELKLKNAKGLRNVRIFGKMRVYAKVSMTGASYSEKQTAVDKHNRTNPKWEFENTYAVRSPEVRNNDIHLVIKLYCKRLFGDRYVGEVSESLGDLFRNGGTADNWRDKDCPVKRGAELSDGFLFISYRFRKTGTPSRRKSFFKNVIGFTTACLGVTQMCSTIA